MAITLCSDYLYVIAMLRTSPLVVTIGLSLTIPLALVGDIFLGIELKNQALFGALLVLLSFVVIGMEDSKEDTHAAVVDTTEDPLETRALVADEGE
jgi:solute carrier family 35 protein F5